MDRNTMTIDAKYLKSARGFTLTELMVTLVCVTVIIGAIFSSFGSQIRIEGGQQNVLDMQANSRIVMDELTWLFRHAGYGCEDSFGAGNTMTGNDPEDGSTLTLGSVLDITNNVSAGTVLNPDEVIVITGFTKVAEVNGDHSNTANITLKNVDTPTISTAVTDFKQYITFSPYSGNVFFQVSTESNPYVVDRPVLRLDADSDVYMVAPTRVQVRNDIDRTLLFQNFAYSSTPDPNQFWEVADGIEDLQFQYTTDNGATWVDDPVNPAEVQAVRIFLLARSTITDANYSDVKTYDLAGQTVGPFNDNFHRSLSTTTVWLRN